MPLYDYYCPKCGIKKEELHGMMEEPKLKCKCGATMKRGVPTGILVQYKGDGFTLAK